MKTIVPLVLAASLLAPASLQAYPLYGSDDTGIGRLVAARLAHEGVIKGKKKRAGELLSLEQVDLRLQDRPDLNLPPTDAAFTKQIKKLLSFNLSRYSISVLDLSDLNNVRYAEHDGSNPRNPGSVGKIVVGTAIFQALADTYPNDIESRRAVLRNTTVTADEFIISDSHTVRRWDPDKQKLIRRPIRVGDQDSLYQWMDWMLSASSNAAAATMSKHAMLIKHFGSTYPISHEEGKKFFKETPKKELTALLTLAQQDPLSRNGIDLTQLRQGSFFTRTGKIKVPGTNSYATTREMMKWLLRMEQGRIVDAWSSRELKRLLYMTERRIRYASSPALNDSAVYFKSGSLYSCAPEEGFTCKKYHGNKLNLMNSIAIVESPAAERKLFYIVTLTSNVLRKNSAVDHQTLATRIHRLLQKTHGVPK